MFGDGKTALRGGADVYYDIGNFGGAMTGNAYVAFPALNVVFPNTTNGIAKKVCGGWEDARRSGLHSSIDLCSPGKRRLWVRNLLRNVKFLQAFSPQVG
jgi:hypothetical protein